MKNMQTLADQILKDSEAIQKRREELPEAKRPNDLDGLKTLRAEIQAYVEKNNRYQKYMDTIRHSKNDYGPANGREGDEIVYPAWQVKTALKESPWAFDTNLKEFIKIFHHCYSPMIEQLKSDTEKLSRRIEQGLALVPSKNEMRSIRKEMKRVTETFQWLQEHEYVYFLGQIDSSGKESISSVTVQPGVPNAMKEYAEKLRNATDRLQKLEAGVRGTDANRIAWIALFVSVGSAILALASFIISSLKS